MPLMGLLVQPAIFYGGRHSHNIDLYLAGSGPLERDLCKLATPLAARIHIGFISHNELIALLDRADIYVYCALVEIEGLLLQTLRNYRRK